MPRYYETTFLIDPQLEEPEISKRLQLYVDILKEAGAFEFRVDRRGTRKLAYDIKGKEGDWRTQGDYAFVMYQGPGTCIEAVEARLRLDEDVLRFMTIRHDKLPPTAFEPSDGTIEVLAPTARPEPRTPRPEPEPKAPAPKPEPAPEAPADEAKPEPPAAEPAPEAPAPEPEKEDAGVADEAEANEAKPETGDEDEAKETGSEQEKE